MYVQTASHFNIIITSIKDWFLCSSVLQPAPSMQLKAMHNREDSDLLFSNGLGKEQQNH